MLSTIGPGGARECSPGFQPRGIAGPEYAPRRGAVDRWQGVLVCRFIPAVIALFIAAFAHAGDWQTTGGGTHQLKEDTLTVNSKGITVYRKIKGNFELRCRMTMISKHRDARAGLVARESLEDGSRYHSNLLLVSKWGFSIREDCWLGHQTQEYGSGGQQTMWLKLVRWNNIITAYRSRDGKNWRSGKGRVFPDLKEVLVVGFWVPGADKAVEAKFTDITVGALKLDYESSWLGNTYSGGYYHVQNMVRAIAVDRTSGKLFTLGNDEFKAVGIYRPDGTLVTIGQSSHFENGNEIAADDKYIYRCNPHRVQRKGKYKKGVRVDDHFGNNVKNFLRDQVITGVAVHGDLLYASNHGKNLIQVLSKADGKELRTFTVETPDNIAIDAKGNLWIAQEKTNKVLHYTADGQKLDGEIGPVGQLRGLAVHPKTGNVWVADAGPKQQFHEFKPDGKLVSSFGAEGGVFAAYADTRPGAVHPLKFNHPTDIDFDKAGNIYVACNGWSKRSGRWMFAGTELFKFSPAKDLLWVRRGLEFVDCADADPASDATSVYTKTHRYEIDFNKPTGRQWTYKATTLNPFKYPEDRRLTAARAAGVLMRRVNDKLFMVGTAMNNQYADLYRFEDDTEFAVSCGRFYEEDGNLVCWQDTNADGKQEKNEVSIGFELAGGLNRLWFVDDNLSLWVQGKEKICRVPCLGLSDAGIPQYDLTKHDEWPVPQPFADDGKTKGLALKRAFYDVKNDRLFLSGFTKENPYIRGSYHWKTAGSEYAAYDGWCHGDRKLLWRALPIEAPKGGRKHGDNSMRGIVAEGDYAFLIHNSTGRVYIYHAVTGKFIRYLQPGPEVAAHTGLIDIVHGIQVHQRKNGEYVIFVEEDHEGKVIMYRWKP